MMILIIMAPVVIVGAVSYRMAANLHRQHVNLAAEENLKLQKKKVEQKFADLRTVLEILSRASTPQEKRSPSLSEIQRRFALRDILAVRANGTVVETVSSPEAAGESVYGDLFINTQLPELFRAGDRMSSFDPEGYNRTGFLVVGVEGRDLSFVAEYGRETLESFLREERSLFNYRITGTEGQFLAGMRPQKYSETEDIPVVTTSDALDIEGLGWNLHVEVDPAVNNFLFGFQKGILIISAGVAFVALLLAWTMLRSLSVLSAPTETSHPRAWGVQEIAIAASALDETGKAQAMACIRKLVRESPVRYSSAPDDAMSADEEDLS